MHSFEVLSNESTCRKKVRLGLEQVIYTKKAIGKPNGPIMLQACVLYQWTEIGNTCGNEVTVEGFYAQQKLSCSDTVDTYYYNPYVGTKCRCIVTKGVCSVCYFDGNIVEKVELLTHSEVVGKNLLPIRRNVYIRILSAQLRIDVVITSITDRKRNRVRRDSWRHLLLKESENDENELEFFDTVSYSVFWGISYTVFWDFKLNIIYMFCVV